MVEALSSYRADVESGAFPAAEHTYEMPDEEWDSLEAELGGESPTVPERRVSGRDLRGHSRNR
jgi:hypothetical protein